MAVESLRILRVFQHISIFAAGSAEKVGAAADGQHATLKSDFALGNNQHAIALMHFFEREPFGFGLKLNQFAHHKAKAVGAAEYAVGQAFLLRVERAGGHFVQRGLPNVEG